VVAESPLNLDAEPRIKKSAGDNAPKGNHPFFWAGYMLVDSGTAAETSEGEKQPPKASPSAKGAAKKPAEGEEPKKPPEAKEPAKPPES